MKKAIFVCLLLSKVTFAGELQVNRYTGVTETGASCTVEVGANNFFLISWDNPNNSAGEKYSSCGFYAKKSKRVNGGNSLNVSGGSEFSVCKAKLNFNESGVLLNAKLGIGTLIKLGYDVTCTIK